MSIRTALAFVVGLALSLGMTIVAIPPALADTDGYPYANATDCSATYGEDSWCINGQDMSPYLYGYRNCTDFVAWKVASLGVPAAQYEGLGNASDWASPPAANKLTVNTTPAVGAAAVDTGGNFGHVAYISAYNPSTGAVTVEEYNEKFDGNYGTRTGTLSGLGFSKVVHFEKYEPSSPSGGSGGSSAPNYEPFAGDFNGDGIGDIGLRDVADGNFFIKHGPSFNDQIVYHWAAGSNYQPFVGDFNGDGITDIGLRNVSTGEIFIKHGPSFNDQVTYQWAAGSNYEVFAGDFNGDGIADIGLRNVSNGNFFIKHGPSFNDQVVYTWAAGLSTISRSSAILTETALQILACAT